MINDYTGNVLHDARHRDLVNEARGGWLLKQARGEEPTSGKTRSIRWILPVALVGGALVIGVLQFAHVV
jgi:hypothetical protein